MNGNLAAIQQSRRRQCVDAITKGCDAPGGRRSPTQPLCDLLAQSHILHATSTRNDESVEWRRVVHIQQRFYDDATFRQTPCGADAERQYLITTVFAIVAGWNPCLGKSFGRSGQLASS